MGAGICKPAKYDENGVPKPPEPASGELILHDNTLLPAPIDPTPKSPAPTSPSSTNATTNNTALNTTAKNATHAAFDTTLPVDPGTTTATQSTTAATAATATATAAPTPSKWDDWDEEEENPEQPSPSKDGSITSDATTHSSSSTVPTSTVPATATTTIKETAEDIGGGSTSQVGISVGSDEAALHGPLSPVVSPTLLCTKCDHDVFCSPNTKWSNNVNYIFVRNYGGVVERLKEELISSETHTAYCCQCGWQNITGRKGLSPFGVPSAPEGGSGAPSEHIFWMVKSRN